jgi:outer membrane biosynthesis protein TonB
VSTLLADTPPAPDGETVQPLPEGSKPPASAGYPVGCGKCGAPMAPDQDWCLQCGGAASRGSSRGSWRPAALIALGTLVLVLGAAVAAYAALKKKAPTAPIVTTTPAQVAPPASTPPPAATTPALPTTTPLVTPGTIAKPPKIPLQAVTPKPAKSNTKASTKTTPPTTTTGSGETSKETSTTNNGGASSEPAPILLDDNAATTYNPYNQPASNFGDPSLAIDDDTSTAWTAQIEPSTAPKLAEGLLIDLQTPQKLATVALVTSTPGMTVQIFGAKTSTAPSSITDPAWVALSHLVVVHHRHARIGLLHKKQAYTLITLWISKAPKSAVGTPTAPGHVSVNEFELFPAGS